MYIVHARDSLSPTVAVTIAAAAAAKLRKSSGMSAAAAASALAGEGTTHMPQLFSLLSADNQGWRHTSIAQFLVVESGSERGKKASLHFTHAFKPQCWHFIGLERTCKLGLVPDDGLMYCMEHLEENLDDRLTDELDSYLDDDKQYA